MKSVIVIYHPDTIKVEDSETIKDRLKSIRESCEVLTICDPNRKKVKVKVFFNPFR